MCIRDRLEILENAGVVSIVGDGIGVDPEKLNDARTIAKDHGVEIHAMTSSPLRLSIFCDESHVDALTKEFHRHFIEGQSQR